MNIMESKKEKAVARFQKAVANCEKAGWELAKEVYYTTTSEDFKELFGTAKAYAKAVNFSPSAISKMCKAYERRLALETELDGAPDAEEFRLNDYTVSQVQEMLRVDEAVNLDFIQFRVVSPEDTTKEIREMVKEYLNPESESEDEGEGEGEAEEAESEPEVKDISFGLQACNNEGVEIVNIWSGKVQKKLSKGQLERILAIINEE